MMDWDYTTGMMIEMGYGIQYLAYLLDLIFERFRYLAGARWSSWNKRHVYCGIPMDNIVAATKIAGHSRFNTRVEFDP